VPLDSIGDKNAMNEEYKKLRYCIEYRSSEISDEEVIPLLLLSRRLKRQKRNSPSSERR